MSMKSKSSHDLTDDPLLSAEVVDTKEDVKIKPEEDSDEQDVSLHFWQLQDTS